MKGIVKFFHPDKGWGFITDGKSDFFVHARNIIDPTEIVYKGQLVEFDTIETERGLMAVQVKIMSLCVDDS